MNIKYLWVKLKKYACEMKFELIASTRPNFTKIAPIIDAIKNTQKEGKNIFFKLVQIGQHYIRNMSGNFFEQLDKS